MIEFTQAAKEKVKEFMGDDPAPSGQVLRIVVKKQGLKGFNYQFYLDEEKYKTDSDEIIPVDAFSLLLDRDSKQYLEGATVDWLETVQGAGFSVNNPNFQNPKSEEPTVKKLLELLDKEINPGVASHGGYVELLDVQDGKAFLKFGGGCQGCGQADVTLKFGIENRIKEVLPEITEVIDITDHQKGENPYYK